MDPPRRDEWQGGSSHNPAPSPGEQEALRPVAQESFGSGASHTPSQPQPAANGPTLPPPQSFFPSHGSNSTNGTLPPIGAIQHSPTVSPRQGQSRPNDQPATIMAPVSRPSQPPGASYSLPGIHSAGQPLSSQAAYERERDREREQEARERDREPGDRGGEALSRINMRGGESRDWAERDPYPQLHGHADAQLHQPVAVAPPGATPIHGPNGILAGAAGPQGNPPPQQPLPPAPGTPNQQVPLFGPHYDSAPRNGQPILPHLQQSAGQFGPTPNGQMIPNVPQGPVVQQQQPILNDALSYLDQVKVTFSGQADVYNQFLDIMKDFKSQAINTPGVIHRVSSLFAGNSALIQGFNTFLPPGYRIECGPDGDPDEIRVRTPLGTLIRPTGQPITSSSGDRMAGANGGSQVYGPDGLIGEQLDGTPYSPSLRPHDGRFQQGHGHQSPFEGRMQREQHHMEVDAAIMQHQQEGRAVAQLQSAASVADQGPVPPPGVSPSMHAGVPMANGLSMVQQGQLDPRRGPVEFNHAISYVNKIKTRFTGQPDIYKQFLDILQTYQRESRPIQDVYSQVTHLFAEAPDLLRDFTKFLPESAAHAKAESARQAAEEMGVMQSNLRGGPDPLDRQSRHTPKPDQRHLPPVGNFHPTPTAARDTKRKRDRAGPVSAPDFGQPGTRTGFGPSKRTKQTLPPPQVVKHTTQLDAPAVEPTLTPALPVPMAPATTTSASNEELAFFDKVKKFVGNKGTMNEFLKLCNLFSQDLIDKNTLVHRAGNFIGESPELFGWFKNFVAYDGHNQVIEMRAKAEHGRVSLNNCRAFGPSYRLLPKRERLATCSGRDELCNSVLNDNWASHPTWSSEDSGFIAHRKNAHEEGLHRIEEERHDYDHHISVCERAVQVLEPLAQSIYNTPTDLQATMKLPADFQAQNHFVFKRVLTRIYGRERAIQVIHNLNERPASVVPVILLRIRQKVEEWKLSQREWEKVWREQTQRMFWRSLDHQGITASMTDKRQFQTKTLQNEIHVKFAEQAHARVKQPGAPPFQMNWSFSDKDVIFDACFLLLTYAEGHHSTDAPKLQVFIKDLIPLFFDLDAEAFNQRMQTIYEGSSPNEDLEEETLASDESSQPRGRKMNGKKGDLLRDVLEKGRRPGRSEKEGSVASGSRASTPDVTPTVEEDLKDAEEAAEEEVRHKTWFTHPSDGNLSQKRNIKPTDPFQRNVYNLYANLPIYCFFRVFAILYERLVQLKANEDEVHEKVRRDKTQKPAIDFGIIDKLPTDYFSDTSPNANYYSQVLGMFEEVARNEGGLTMLQVQDVLRRYYLAHGWLMYSFEKMASALARFGTAILSNDPKERSNDVMTLFMKDRRKEFTTHQDEVTYRRQVEKYVKDADIYRLAYSSTKSTLKARLMKKDESTFDTGAGSTYTDGLLTPEERWRLYITLYESMEPTEGVDQSKVGTSYAKHALRDAVKKVELDATRAQQNLEGTDSDLPPKSTLETRADQLLSHDNLELRISPTTYVIHWEDREDQDTSDWWIVRSRSANKNVDPEAKDEATKEEQADESEKHDLENERTASFMELLVMNNAWMKGLSRDAVDEANSEFRKWKGDEEGETKKDADTVMEG